MSKKILAVCQLTNFGGIAIFDVVHGIDDKIKFAYHNGEEFGRTSTAKIRYNKEGDAYFNSGRQKYYLNEFIKSEDE